MNCPLQFSRLLKNVMSAGKTRQNEVLTELRRLYNYDNNINTASLIGIAGCAAYFGDPEFAMDVIEKALRVGASGTFYVWLPLNAGSSTVTSIQKN